MLYFPDANYFRDARHGVFERAGLIRKDIGMHYVAARELRRPSRVFGCKAGGANLSVWNASAKSSTTETGCSK